VLIERGETSRGTELLAATSAMFEARQTVLDPADQPEFDSAIEGARQALGEIEFDRAWTKGRALSDDYAIAHALA
jgi:hypothetical protein